MVDCVDGVFFVKGAQQNQGKIFDFNEDDFISSCEEAIKRVESNPLNDKGLELQEQFSYEKCYDNILNVLNE